eukprot:7470215-Lingulodinium_polyedra.AAC.1
MGDAAEGAEAVAAAARVPVPPDVAPELSEEQFAKLWMMGVSSERSLGRPRDWDGADAKFEEFTWKFSRWLGGLPGDVIRMLE